MKPSRRQFLTGAAATAAMRPLLAWAENGGDTLVVRADGDIQVLDPAFQSGMIEEEVGRAIFPSLNRLGPAGAPLAWMPQAAATLDPSDPLTVRFVLRDGLNWSNGYGPVTAEDVKFSFERIADPKLGSPWQYAFEALDHVEVLDARTGVIRLKTPYIPLLTSSLPFWTGHIVCKAAVEKAGGRFNADSPATCGPYRIAEWQPKQSITLVADPAWPGPPADFNKVQFRIVEDADSALLAFEARAVDFTRISLNALASYRKALPPATRLIEMPGLRYQWLTLNIANPKLKDPRVRRAIQRAIDIDQILAGAYSDLCPASTGVVLPGMTGHRDRILYPYDKAEAKRLLAEAKAEDLSLELAILSGQTDLLVAQIIQALLADVGIDVRIRQYDDGVYWSLGDKTAGDGWKSLELVLRYTTSGVDPAENLTWFRPGQIGAWNWSAFDSPEFESLYAQGLSENDTARRADIYRRMQDLMEESGGFVFIAIETYAAVYRPWIAPFVTPDDLTDITRFSRAQSRETATP
ncbi:MAG TPA: ABC transporter substrate-binding protein [Alphaproteobacteria bacterium]|jgi:peptide/nickel transport system substrate-binding protein|nr:ABC transporter substrate-binding protein [Alphaproteobacteria bacterium]